MNSTYICRHCDQYHTSCKSEKQFQKRQETKFLKFKDLYKLEPKPHLQNFSVNSKKKLDCNRLVYDIQEYSYGKMLRYGNGMKIGQISRVGKILAEIQGDGQQQKRKSQKGKKNLSHKIQISKRPLKTEYSQLKTSREKLYGFQMTPINKGKNMSDNKKEVTDTVERTRVKTNNSISKNIVQSQFESWNKYQVVEQQDLKKLYVCSWNEEKLENKKRCSYFDNRCLGFDCSEVGQIHVFQEYHLL